MFKHVLKGNIKGGVVKRGSTLGITLDELKKWASGESTYSSHFRVSMFINTRFNIAYLFSGIVAELNIIFAVIFFHTV